MTRSTRSPRTSPARRPRARCRSPPHSSPTTRSSPTARRTARASSRHSAISPSTRGPSGRSQSSPRRSRPTRPSRVCHRIAHALGAGGLAHYDGDVGSAFVDGSAVCWSGYYHGILERAFAGVSEEDLPAVSRRLCASDQVRTERLRRVPVRPRARPRPDDLHGLRHASVARDVRRARDELGPDLVHGRRVHGEPPDVVRDSLEVVAGGRSALPVPHRGRAAQALLLPDGDVAHPRRRRRRLGADRRLVPQGRAWLGGHVLPVARPGCLRPVAPGSAGDHPHLLAGRDDGGPVHLRRGARHHEHGRRCASLVGVLLRGQRAAAGRVLQRDRHDPRRVLPRSGRRRAACRSAVPKQYWDECFAGAGA